MLPPQGLTAATGRKRKAAAIGEEFSLSAFLPTSFGKKAEKHDYEGAVAGTRKKKVSAKEFAPKKVGPKAPAPVYEWGTTRTLSICACALISQGKNMPVDKEKVEREKAATAEVVDLDEENPYRIPYAYEVVMKGHGSVVTALALGTDTLIRDPCCSIHRSQKQQIPPDRVSCPVTTHLRSKCGTLTRWIQRLDPSERLSLRM